MNKTLLKTCSKPFNCKTSGSATTPQEFQEKKTSKTKQRTPSDKQEKAQKQGKINSKEEKFETTFNKTKTRKAHFKDSMESN